MSTPDPVVRWAAPLLGGPIGRRLRPGGGGAGYLVLAGLGLSLLLGLVLQSQCQPSGWMGPVAYARMCRSSLAEGYLDPLALSVAGGGPSGLAALLRLLTGDVTTFLAMAAVINVIAFAAAGVALVRLARPGEAWWLLLFSLSPIVILGWLQTFDVVGVAFALWALVLWRQTERTSTVELGVVGLLIGVGAQFSPYALVVLAALAIYTALGQGPRPLTDLLVMVGSFAVASGILLVADGRAPARLEAWLGGAVGPGSVLSIAEALGIQPGRYVIIGVLITVLLLGTLAVLLRRLTAEGHRINLWALVTLMLTVALLLSPTLDLSNVLWLLPFAALSIHDSRVHLPWMVIEAVTAVAISLYLMGQIDPAGQDDVRALPVALVMPIVALRLIMLLVIGYQAGARLLSPGESRGDGAQEAAGPLAEAPPSQESEQRPRH